MFKKIKRFVIWVCLQLSPYLLELGVFCVTSIYAVWHIGIALSSNFVASASVVIFHHYPLYSGQYLKNGLSDLIQIWHVDVTAYHGVLYSLVTLNSH